MDHTHEAKLLLELFNSNGRASQHNNGNTTSILDIGAGVAGQPPNNNGSHTAAQQQQQQQQTTRTTQADLHFLKLANELIQASEIKTKIDPSIKKLLERAQYFASPHGGSPINGIFYDPKTVASSSSVDFLQSHTSHPEIAHNNHENGSDSVARTPNGSQATSSHNNFPDLSLNEFRPREVKQEFLVDEGSPQDDPKPFICVKCHLSFRRSSDLKRHEKTHLEVLPNICKLCHKGFARKDALKRHVETLTCRRNRERLLQSLGIPNNEHEKDIELNVILKNNGINEEDDDDDDEEEEDEK